MAYFVTGATGFIGRYLVANLLRRGHPVYVLVRKGSEKKLAAIRKAWGADDKTVIGIEGDLAKPGLGVGAADVKKLKGKIDHFFHLAAIYDLKASAEAQQIANVDGTKNAVRFAGTVGAGCFHHVSSIAAAGLYEGTFREDMFEEAEDLDHPYFKTKHDSEGVVRRECKRPFRIYRPGFVVGHSKTGEIDKIDGPVLLLQDAAETARHGAALDADDRHRGRAHQHRAGRFRRRRARLPRAQEGPRRPVLPPDRPRAAPDRRGAQHLRPRGARAADDDAHQCEDVRLHPGARPVRHRLPRADQARDPGRADRSRHPARRVPVRQLAHALRQPRSREGAQGLGHRGAARSRPTPRSSGITGSATSTRTFSSTARSPAASRTR